MEFSVDGGQLLLCMSDLVAHQSQMEANQLLKCMIHYMGSHQFHPEFQISLANLKRLLTESAEEQKVNELRNISFE